MNNFYVMAKEDIDKLPDSELKQLATEINEQWFGYSLIHEIPIIVARRILDREGKKK